MKKIRWNILVIVMLVLLPAIVWAEEPDSDGDGIPDSQDECPFSTNMTQLTNEFGEEFAPKWSPDGTKIAFSFDQNGYSNIWVMNADGSSPQQLTFDEFGDGSNSFPAWSPDGSQLVFTSDRNGYSNIWVMNVNGSSPQQLTFNGVDGIYFSFPDWSPDGTQIVYAIERNIWVMDANGGNAHYLTNSGTDYMPAWSPDGSKIAYRSIGDIWVMDSNGDNAEQLTDTVTLDMMPAWSPDGSQIVYGALNDGSYDLWIISSDGTSEPVQLTFDASSIRWPDWSPDGSQLVVTSDPSTSDTSDIWIYQFSADSDGDGILDCNDSCPNDNPDDVDGDGVCDSVDNCESYNPDQSDIDEDDVGDVCDECPLFNNFIQLTDTYPEQEYAAAFSPDGTKIAFHLMLYRSRDIWVIDADGSNAVQLTDSPENETHPAWSPDGSQIAFTSNLDGNNDIWLMNADGSGLPVQLTSDSGSNGEANWSPDGSQIAFFSSRAGSADIWVMNADGNNQVPLTTESSSERAPSWSPDGTQIAFHSGPTAAGNNDIWVMNADGSFPQQLTFEPTSFMRPDWSPDGTKLVFNSDQDNADIWIMDADGTNLVQFTIDPNSDRSPSWSPDGTKIAFQSNRTGNNELWLYRFDLDDDCLADLPNSDNCPDDPYKDEPGQCGCGVADIHSDSDGTADCNDPCPQDPWKIDPGICDCGTADIDSEPDGVMDCIDNCPTISNYLQSDLDGDGSGDLCDPCPLDTSPTCDNPTTAAEEIQADQGGTVTTDNGSTTVSVEAGDLSTDATVSVWENTQPGEADLLLDNNISKGESVLGVEFGPDGLEFTNPVTITLTAIVTELNPGQRNNLDIYQYEDTDGDGNEDTYLPLHAACSFFEDPPGTTIAVCSAEINHFSIYALIAPKDSDNDGVFDLFNGVEDKCPAIAAGDATLNYTGSMLVSTSEDAGVSALLADADHMPLADVPVTFELDSSIGSTVQTCSTLTDTTGAAGCVFSGLAPDVYTVRVLSAASGCPQAITESLLVVFDPDTPRATGGGFILPDEDSTISAITDQDKANFGFIVKLNKNQDADGNLEFQYKSADINLKSQAMTWYTTSNNRAMFQGEATINGEGLYTFRVTATDGDLTGDQPDAFNITIWEGTDTESDPYHKAKNNLAGGSIVIHKK